LLFLPGADVVLVVDVVWAVAFLPVVAVVVAQAVQLAQVC
jgi:hypothetical protein